MTFSRHTGNCSPLLLPADGPVVEAQADDHPTPTARPPRLARGIDVREKASTRSSSMTSTASTRHPPPGSASRQAMPRTCRVPGERCGGLPRARSKCPGSERGAMTSTSWDNSSGSMLSPAHSANAASRLNDPWGERTWAARGSAVPRSSASASPAAATAASRPDLPRPGAGVPASSSRAARACHGPACVVAESPGTASASRRSTHAPGAGSPAGPGTGSGGPSSSSAACLPHARPATRADTAANGSSPEPQDSRAGASNPAQANVDGGPAGPASTATTRIPMTRIKPGFDRTRNRAAPCHQAARPDPLTLLRRPAASRLPARPTPACLTHRRFRRRWTIQSAHRSGRHGGRSPGILPDLRSAADIFG